MKVTINKVEKQNQAQKKKFFSKYDKKKKKACFQGSLERKKKRQRRKITKGGKEAEREGRNRFVKTYTFV